MSAIFFKQLVIISSLLFAFSVSATTYRPLSLSDQLSEADGVILGECNGFAYKRTRTGEVVTEFSFKVSRYAGITLNEIVNPNNFRVQVPGGVFQHVVYYVEGAPKFKDGDKVVLLINKGIDGFVVSNLALGKYNVEMVEKESVLNSSIFPTHPQLAKISFDRFENHLVNRYSSGFKLVNGDKHIFTAQDIPSKTNIGIRKPASTKHNNNVEIGNGYSGPQLIVLLVIFLFIGLMAFMIIKGKE